MMNDFPNAGFSTINIRNARIHTQRFSGDREPRMLYSQLVSDITRDPNKLFCQLYIAPLIE
jgi:hypothetical protein